MPVSAINPRKQAGEQSTKIEIGSLVEYELHGRPILGIAIGLKQDKWILHTEEDAEAALPAQRLYLLSSKVNAPVHDRTKIPPFIKNFIEEADATAHTIDLAKLWQNTHSREREYSTAELAALLFGNTTLIQHLAARRTLLGDKVFFKRKKAGFVPRSAHDLNELKERAEAERKKNEALEQTIIALLDRLAERSADLPPTISVVEELAVLGKGAPNGRDGAFIVDETLRRASIGFEGSPGERAFQLLVAVKYFTEDQNLLLARARRSVEFSENLEAEARELSTHRDHVCKNRPLATNAVVFAIDEATTKDVDDALSIEQTVNGYRIGVHISDVTALVASGSALEAEAFRRGTSIYFAEETVPMFPGALSENAVSLLEGSPRPALSFYVECDAQYKILNRSIQRTAVTVSHRTNYDDVDALLYQENAKSFSGSAELVFSIQRLWDIVSTLEQQRVARGAVQFNKREMTPRIRHDKVTLEFVDFDSPGHKLVSELMILANETAALFAAQNGIPLFFRGQEAPDFDITKYAHEIPVGPAREYAQKGLLKRSTTSVTVEPHAGVGVEAYAQVTSPIRRVLDFVNHRQLTNYLEHKVPAFDGTKLQELFVVLEPQVDEAQIIQRERQRYWLLKYLQQEQIKEIDATVLKTDGNRPLAELAIINSSFYFTPLELPVTAARNKALKPGDKVKLMIEKIDPRNEVLRLKQTG